MAGIILGLIFLLLACCIFYAGRKEDQVKVHMLVSFWGCIICANIWFASNA